MYTCVMLMRKSFRALQDWRLKRLVEQARIIDIAPEEREAQRRSFAYGNLKMSRPELTRGDIDHAADALVKETCT